MENKGQITNTAGTPVPSVLYKASSPGMDVYITRDGLSCVFVKIEEGEKCSITGKKKIRFRMEMSWLNVRLVGARILPENIVHEEPMPEQYNYFRSHCPDGIYGIRRYGKILIKNVYPGIDWVIYGHSVKGIKYDFIVHSGGNPDDIRLAYEGEHPAEIDPSGGLVMDTRLGRFSEGAPESFLAGVSVPTVFRKISERRLNPAGYESVYGFHVRCDAKAILPGESLIIDPAIAWATFFGGSNFDGPKSAETDNNGNLFVCGYTVSTDFPMQSAGTYYQPVFGGGTSDVFILKFDNTSALLWATYYGGAGSDEFANFIDVAANGDILLTGYTQSSNFPVQNTGTYFQAANAGGKDAFILKFNNAGIRLWATYYGGAGDEEGNSITLDASGNIFVAGFTESANFPVQNAGTYFQAANGGTCNGFVLKFDNSGNRLWATYYGGSATDVASCISADPAGNIFVVGVTISGNFPVQNAGTYFQGTQASTQDAFILKFDNSGNRLWATYYGGAGAKNLASSVIADDLGNVFVTGSSGSLTFPLQNAGTFYQGTNAGGMDMFILKFNNAGSRLWATYYGGSGDDEMHAFDNLALDTCNNIYVGMHTNSPDFPTKASCDNGYLSTGFSGGVSDIGITVFDNSGTHLWATYSGGDGQDFRSALAVDPNNNLYIAGEWINVVANSSYPLTNVGGYFDGTYNLGDDGYIMKFTGDPCMCTNVLALTATVTPVLCNAQCTGTASATAVSGNAPYSYLWSGGGTTQTVTGLCAGIYTVTITDASSATASATVSVTQPPALTATGSSVPASCSGNNGSASLTASGGTPGYSYTWNTTPQQTTQTATGLASGTFSVTITEANGCTYTQTVLVTSSNNLSVNMSATPSSCTASNGSALAFPANGTAPYSYVWSGGQTVSAISGLSAGTYSVWVSDANGCTQSQTVTVGQTGGVPAVASASPVSIASGGSTTLSANAGTGYLWSPGSGLSCDTCQSAVASPAVTTIYCVNVTDTNGCVDSSCVTIIVYPEPTDCSSPGELYVPNAFSPNDDGENDVLQAYIRDISCIEKFSLRIYNRWGEQVFSTEDVAGGWDGKYHDKPLDPAVFTYYMKAELIHGAKINRKGNVTLVR